MRVLKFGGTSLGNAFMMRSVAAIIRNETDCIIVCSAMAGITDKLTDLCMAWQKGDSIKVQAVLNELEVQFQKTCFDLLPAGLYEKGYAEVVMHLNQINDATTRHYIPEMGKWLLAQGEIITTQIFSFFLNHTGCRIMPLDALDFVHTNAAGEPEINDIRQRLESVDGYSAEGRYLTQGYICRDHEGKIDNLRRGGSDYTATLLGAAAGASSVEIWTDIDGLRQNDPRFVKNTDIVAELSFGEAAELAFFGAKILHPSCVWPASQNNIPIRLKYTMQPAQAGTLIHSVSRKSGIRAVAAKDNIRMIRIRSARMLNAYGFLRKIFEIFEVYKTPIDVITTSEVAVSLTIDNPEHLDEICSELNAFGIVEVEKDLSIVCVVGDVLGRNKGCTARILTVLSDMPVKMVSLGGSHNNLTLVLPSVYRKEALNILQATFFNENDLTHSYPLSQV